MRRCEKNYSCAALHFKRLTEHSALLGKQMKALGEHKAEVCGWNGDGADTLAGLSRAQTTTVKTINVASSTPGWFVLTSGAFSELSACSAQIVTEQLQ